MGTDDISVSGCPTLRKVLRNRLTAYPEFSRFRSERIPSNAPQLNSGHAKMNEPCPIAQPLKNGHFMTLKIIINGIIKKNPAIQAMTRETHPVVILSKVRAFMAISFTSAAS